jgi:hypothetical protein
MANFGTSLNPESLKYQYKGEWSPHQSYVKHDLVRWMGRTWFCKSANEMRVKGLAHRPDNDSSMWGKNGAHHVIRGGFSPHFKYFVGDVVKYAGDWYHCEEDNEGQNPVYENGGLTNKWTRMASSPKTKDASLYIPHFGGWSPLGWTKYNGQTHAESGNASGEEQSSGVILMNHRQELMRYGIVEDGDWSGMGDAMVSGRFANRKACISNSQLIEYLHRGKASITGGVPKPVQWESGMGDIKILYDNGELYSLSINNQRQGGFGDFTESRKLLQRVGVRDDNTKWTNSVSGTLLNEFVIKFCGGTNPRDTAGGTCAALTLSGEVWTWGENNIGQLGQGSNNIDNGLPKQIPQKLFGNKLIKDIYCSKDTNQSSEGHMFFAIDEDGMLWCWGSNALRTFGGGENGDMRAPLRIGDFAKHGGIKEVITGQTYHSVWVHCVDGAMYLVGGRVDYTYMQPDAEVGIDTWMGGGPKLLTDFVYGMHKRINGDHAGLDRLGSLDALENIDKAWVHGRRVQGMTMKTKEGDIFQWGYLQPSSGMVRTSETGLDDGSRIFHFTSNLPVAPVPLHTTGTAQARDIVHMSWASDSDSAYSGGKAQGYLSHDGHVQWIGDDQRHVGLGAGDASTNELGQTGNWRATELPMNQDSAGYGVSRRGGRTAMFGAATIRGLTSELSYSSDVTTYQSQLCIDQEGVATVIGHNHRVIEGMADMHQSLGTAVENLDAESYALRLS